MSDVGLPAIFDPLLDYLEDLLPPTAYSILTNLLTYTIALATALFTFVATLVTSGSPLEWNAEQILPPLITLLAAYLALVSFYRTTGWMIRTAFAFVKWSAIIGILSASAGYFLANAGNEGENGVGGLLGGVAGLVPMIGGFILNMLNGRDEQGSGGRQQNTRNTRASTRSASSRSSRSRTQANSGSRPKAWESWDRHRDWQYDESQNRQAGQSGEDVQKVIGEVLGAAGRVVKESGWWETAKGVVNEFQKATEGRGDTGEGSSGRRKQPPRKAKSQEKQGAKR
ncbi:hypothetical protein K474DRAFT_1668688 [Panus rudis PR-1116 ss-1]|nr:hypothetical protein K474DRAFT_1668688 [Panus rudis PR-1116 ss-1]